MIIIDIVAGIFVGALVGLGVGGGGLLVIYLTLFKHTEQLKAQSVNLLFFVVTAVVSLFFHLKQHKINMRIVAFIAVSGCIGAIAGSICVNYIPTNIVRMIFGGLLIFGGIYEIFCKK